MSLSLRLIVCRFSSYLSTFKKSFIFTRICDSLRFILFFPQFFFYTWQLNKNWVPIRLKKTIFYWYAKQISNLFHHFIFSYTHNRVQTDSSLSNMYIFFTGSTIRARFWHLESTVNHYRKCRPHVLSFDFRHVNGMKYTSNVNKKLSKTD